MEEKKRGTYIGGPDAAAIVGANPWYKPLDVALRLRGETGQLEDNWRMRAGRVLERELLDDYEQRRGVRVVERNSFRAHPAFGWSGSHIDGLVGHARPGRVVECKTTQSEDGYGLEGTDEVPEYVLLQCVYYMPIWEADSVDVVALFHTRDQRDYHVTRDPELESMLYAECDEFWQRVMVHGELPPMNGSDSCHAYLARKYPRDERPVLKADPDTEVLMIALREARGTLALNEEYVSTLEAQLKNIIGDAAGVEGPPGKITWKAGKPTSKVDWQKIAEYLKDKVAEATYRELVRQYTTQKTGSRRFLVPRSWDKKEGDDE